PEPVPGPGEVVVQVKRAGICATDLELAKGYMGFKGVLGHELLGTVDGRRVTAEINFACGHCATCRGNERNNSLLPGPSVGLRASGVTPTGSLRSHCPHRSVLGILGHDGALAERVAIPTSALHDVPERVPDEAAAFAEPLA